MQSGGGYNVVNGPGYDSKTDANNRVLSYYTDTTISHMDASLTEISATCAMTEQRESAFHEPKEWSRSIQILFYNDREDGPTNVQRTSQSLCKPPVWCRIEAPHRRNYI